ncbi:MAG: phosphoribosylglycinamide formyltransferase [Clostridia bacterium]|nr:phosphoribosylglycinamide formyltransferase [Clostridia bacterium]
MVRIAVFVSGGGTNLQALIDAQKAGKIVNGEIVLVVSSKAEAYALRRAEKAGIKSQVVSRKAFDTADDFNDALLKVLQDEKIDLVVLAGFMSILGGNILSAYKNKIINVHPSLIPSFCGDGFYGLRVHQAALDYGVKVTGATVHFVNEITDGGKIILQKAVDILPDDTPETLQKRVMEQAEWQILPQAVSMFCQGLI